MFIIILKVEHYGKSLLIVPSCIKITIHHFPLTHKSSIEAINDPNNNYVS